MNSPLGFASRCRVGSALKAGATAILMLALFCLGGSGLLVAQTPPPADPLMQLMLTQPPIDISTNVAVTAGFDPPVIALDGQSTYRVTINAVSDSIRWPEDILAPLELTLRPSSRGQILQPGVDKIRPSTTINHRVTATKTGGFTIPEFKLRVYGNPVTVPAARLEVVPQLRSGTPAPQRLYLQLAASNVYCGQPIKIQIFLPSAGGNSIQALSQVQVNGDGVLLDQSTVRQRIQPLEFHGRTGPAFIYESTITPLVAGRLEVSAQAFTIGNLFSGNVSIQGNAVIPGAPQYVLLDSDPVALAVEPLPRAGELPGFTGAIGKFTALPPRLSTEVLRVGDMVRVIAAFECEGDAKRLLAPPPPAVTNWQVFPAVAEASAVQTANPSGGVSTVVAFNYTMIPLTNNLTATPAIPFAVFDPEQKQYVDLTIPPQSITVRAGAASAEAQALAQAAAAERPHSKLSLSPLATAPGRRGNPLARLQTSPLFLGLQLLPLAALTMLWYWDRRRRFLEQHPEIVRRRVARRALRRERQVLRAAARANDETRFAASAVQALRLACAPHFPATPRALVGRDILEVFDDSTREGRTAEMIRALFAKTDGAQFGALPLQAGELLTWQPELDGLLDVLEAKL